MYFRTTSLCAILGINIVLFLCPFLVSGQQPDLHWVGAWATAPTRSALSIQLHDKTIRQIVHVSLAGRSLRIHLSNRYGAAPLIVDGAHIARWSGGSSILEGSDRSLLFGGQQKIVIEAGGEAASDAVEFPIGAQDNIVVSLHVAAAPSPATWHSSAYQTNYITDGNHLVDSSLNHATTIKSYLLLSGLDTLAGDSAGALVAFGASITDGTASSFDMNLRWPDDLARRLAHAGMPVGVLNLGIGGNRLLVDGGSESALKRFDRDVATQPGVRWVIFSDDPINDLGSTKPQPTAEALIVGIRALIVRAHAAHLKFLCSTLTPYEGAGYWNVSGEAARQAINSFLRSASSGCDGLVDQDVATHDPEHPTRYLPAYDSGDHLHPNNAGMQAIADAVHLNQLTR